MLHDGDNKSSVVVIPSGFGTSGITLNGLIDEGLISGGSADTSVGGAWAWSPGL